MKQVFLFSLLFLFGGSLQAQSRFGAEAGFNLATVHVEGAGHKARPGFHAGGFAQVPLGGGWWLRPSLLYSLKGYRAPATQFSGEATVGLRYLAVPLLLGFQPASHLLVLFGPEAGYLLAAKSTFDGSTNNVTRFYRRFDLGVDLGLSYRLQNRIGFHLRYNYGFRDLMNAVFTDPYGNITGQGKIGANRVLQAGLFFPLW